MTKPTNPFEQEAQWDKWVFGVGLPLLFLWPALGILVNQTGFLIGRPILRMEIHGFDATLQGLGLIGAAAYLHFNRFWKNDDRLERYHRCGEHLSITCFAMTTVSLVSRVFMATFGNW